MTRGKDMLEAYRIEFNKKLREYNYSKQFTLSRELLDQVVKEKALHGFNMLLITLPAILRPSDQHDADSTAMFSDENARERAFRDMIQNELYVKYLRFHLKQFNDIGALDIAF